MGGGGVFEFRSCPRWDFVPAVAAPDFQCFSLSNKIRYYVIILNLNVPQGDVTRLLGFRTRFRARITNNWDLRRLLFRGLIINLTYIDDIICLRLSVL